MPKAKLHFSKDGNAITGITWIIDNEIPNNLVYAMPTKRVCKNCEKLGVTDSSDIYISCADCLEWKRKLQGR